MLSLHPLAVTVQADRERTIRVQAPAPAGRAMALVHPVRPVSPEPLGQVPPRVATATGRG